MKSNIYSKFAILFLSLSVSITAYADVKIKAKQTVSGQTTENTVLIKGKRQRTESVNGQMVSITQCDLHRDLRLIPATQNYQISLFDNGAGNPAGQIVDVKNTPVTKGGTISTLINTKDTGERRQMFGYTAKHIITTMETNSSPDACILTKNKIQYDGWYIEAEFALDCTQNRRYSVTNKQTGGCQDKTELKTVGVTKKGYPLLEKMTMFDASGKESFTMETEVVELSKATLNAELFDIPSGWTEVKDSADLYNTASYKNGAVKIPGQTEQQNSGENSSTDVSGMNQSVKNLSKNPAGTLNQVSAKKEGTVRIGLANVKVGSVGEGINGQELAAAIQNSLGEYLKGSKVELLPLETKLASAMESEAKEKQCDFILYTQISHKKGGGGFGMFKAIAPILTNVIPMAGGTGSAIAGSVASSVITTATATSNVKPKDEVTLDINIKSTSGGTVALTKQYKGKAKSGGEDIISPMIEQAAQAIIDSVAK